MELQQTIDGILTPTASDILGQVIAVNGSRASIGMLATVGIEHARMTVSKFILINGARSHLVAVVTSISLDVPLGARDIGCCAVAEVDLMGEFLVNGVDQIRFRRGVSEYPSIGDVAASLSSTKFQMIYDKPDIVSGSVGVLTQDGKTPAPILINETVHKHFAVLGTTGVGKSSAVMVVLREILASRPDLRIFLLDAHNEYSKFFGDQAVTLSLRDLKLPFWLFNFEEIVDVFFGGRAGNTEEISILAEVIPLAKATYFRSHGGDRGQARRPDQINGSYTADTPVPYILGDLIGLIDERMGKLENRSTRMIHHKLIGRIETVRNDPRYAFMFENANVGGDTFCDVLIQLFRLIPCGKPMTVMQLAKFPAEVLDAVVSVLGRLAFDFALWSDGAFPLLFVCEEAHRYASADRNIGFGPTRRAISRIAKEGRKYGVFLGLISQRPAELDPTILSQCSTLFVMRLANDRDQAILRSAVSDAGASLLNFIPSLGTAEAFVFGEGVAVPTRLRFSDVLAQQDASFRPRSGDETQDYQLIVSVVDRWRGTLSSSTRRDEMPSKETVTASVAPSSALDRMTASGASVPSGAGIDPTRFSILKKPIALRK